MIRPIVLIVVAVLLGAFGQVLIKWGTMRLRDGWSAPDGLFLLRALSDLTVASGVLLYAASALLWILAVSKVDLSYAYPLVASGYVLVFLFSYFIFHEPIPPMRWMGLLLIVAGVILVART